VITAETETETEMIVIATTGLTDTDMKTLGSRAIAMA
jgi:hypothetical protein